MTSADHYRTVSRWLYLKAQGTPSSSVGYRRAVSTAYYAVFRLIIDDSIELLFNGSEQNEAVRRIFARQFNHGSMYATFNKLNGENPIEKSSKFWLSILAEPAIPKMNEKGNVKIDGKGKPVFEPVFPLKPIITLAQLFNGLQEDRHKADYNMYESAFDRIATQEVLINMDQFFDTWQHLRTTNLEIINTLCYHLLFPDVVVRE